jgi:hypothetical protein
VSAQLAKYRVLCLRRFFSRWSSPDWIDFDCMTLPAGHNVTVNISVMTSMIRVGRRTPKARAGLATSALAHQRPFSAATLPGLSNEATFNRGQRRGVRPIRSLSTALDVGRSPSTRSLSSTTTLFSAANYWRGSLVSSEPLRLRSQWTARSEVSQVKHFSRTALWLQGKDAAEQGHAGKEVSRYEQAVFSRRNLMKAE